MTGWNQSDLTALANTDADRRRAARDTRELVRWLREQGCPWSLIGEALGVSRQSAWEKYGKHRPEQSG